MRPDAFLVEAISLSGVGEIASSKASSQRHTACRCETRCFSGRGNLTLGVGGDCFVAKPPRKDTRHVIARPDAFLVEAISLLGVGGDCFVAKPPRKDTRHVVARPDAFLVEAISLSGVGEIASSQSLLAKTHGMSLRDQMLFWSRQSHFWAWGVIASSQSLLAKTHGMSLRDQMLFWSRQSHFWAWGVIASSQSLLAKTHGMSLRDQRFSGRSNLTFGHGRNCFVAKPPRKAHTACRCETRRFSG